LCIFALPLLQHEGNPRPLANMKLSALAVGSAIVTANAAVLGDPSQFVERAAYAVVGKPEGFASGTTGGGSAACAIPSSVAQLKTWLTDSTARCIVLDKE
jgi:pectin lyase